MDYDEVLQQLGELGSYQKRLLTLSLLPILYNAFGGPVSNFLLGDHLHRCKIPDYPNDTYAVQNDLHAAAINATIPVLSDGSYDSCHLIFNGTQQNCNEWVFDQSIFTRTVNSQFLAVCARKLYLSHAIMTYFFGYMVSAITMCPLADLLGRRLCSCITLTLMAITNLLMPFSTNIYMFAVLRFFDGFFGLAFYTFAFLIGIEMVGPHERQITGTLILLAYCLGQFILLLVAYFVRDWFWLQLTLAIPMIPSIVYWWPKILPESPRWLLSRNRRKEALKIIMKAATVNKVKLTEEIKNIKLEEGEDIGIVVILKNLFSSRVLICRWMIIFLNWFVISFIYYGIQLNISKWGDDLYLTFFITVVVETFGYSLVFFINKTGRRRMHLVTMFSMALVCIASMCTILLNESSHQWISITLAMIGKLLISLAFGVVYVYTGELFPTVVRGVVIGMSSFGARLGSLITPYLYYLMDGKMQNAFPLILYTATIMIAAFVSCYLPETSNRKLMEHVHDAEHEERLKIDDKGTFRTVGDEDKMDDEESV